MTETAIGSIIDQDEFWETEHDSVTPDLKDEDFGLTPSLVKSKAYAANRHASRVAMQRRRMSRTIARERVQKAVQKAVTDFYNLPDIWADSERIAKSGLTFSQFTEHVVSARG